MLRNTDGGSRWMIKALGFDLDNTLYDQCQHFYSFVREIAPDVAQETHLPIGVVEQRFVEAFRVRTSYYPYLFDEVTQSLGCWRKELVSGLIERYHEHSAPLELYPGTRETLARLSRRFSLFVITDGHGGMQRRKVERLGLSPLFKVVVYTSDHGKHWQKPSPQPFRYVVGLLNVEPNQCVYVGDNPRCDFAGASETGMIAVRVLTGPFAEMVAQPEDGPDYIVGNVLDVEELVLSLSQHC